MKRIYLLIILVVGCVMLSAQQDPFTNRIPCHLKASRVGTTYLGECSRGCKL